MLSRGLDGGDCRGCHRNSLNVDAVRIVDNARGTIRVQRPQQVGTAFFSYLTRTFWSLYNYSTGLPVRDLFALAGNPEEIFGRQRQPTEIVVGRVYPLENVGEHEEIRFVVSDT